MNRESRTLGRASASAPGTCGELVQGMLNGRHFMITCPIDMYSVATVELSHGKGGVSGPLDSPKARRAVRSTLDCLGESEAQARLWLDSQLPRGKGMASSTADVCAAIQATTAALSQTISPRMMARIALTIEPSDGVMFSGIAIFDHRSGRIARTLGQPPPMFILAMDFGGWVDTLEFNQVDRESVLESLEFEMREAVSLVEEGIRKRDPILVGRGATVSALANQRVTFNPNLETVLALSRQSGAIGVNVAHSGSVIGTLFADDERMVDRAAELARQSLPGLRSISRHRIVSGGVRICQSARSGCARRT